LAVTNKLSSHIKSALAGSQGCFQRPVVPRETSRYANAQPGVTGHMDRFRKANYVLHEREWNKVGKEMRIECVTTSIKPCNVSGLWKTEKPARTTQHPLPAMESEAKAGSPR